MGWYLGTKMQYMWLFKKIPFGSREAETANSSHFQDGRRHSRTSSRLRDTNTLESLETPIRPWPRKTFEERACAKLNVSWPSPSRSHGLCVHSLARGALISLKNRAVLLLQAFVRRQFGSRTEAVLSLEVHMRKRWDETAQCHVWPIFGIGISAMCREYIMFAVKLLDALKKWMNSYSSNDSITITPNVIRSAIC